MKNESKDILERIDALLLEGSVIRKPNFITKDNILEAISLIKDEVKEDDTLLTTFSENVEMNWTIANSVFIIKQFEKILEYYNITGKSNNRKTILEVKNKTLLRKIVNLKCAPQIKKIINE